MDLSEMIRGMAEDARLSARMLRSARRSEKDTALESMADALVSRKKEIVEINAKDVSLAREKGLNPAMIDRLTLSEPTIASMVSGLREVAALPDPVGEVTGMWKRPNGLQVGRVRVPTFVIELITGAEEKVFTPARV